MTEFFFNLVWLIPILPLAAFAIIVLWTNRNRLLSTWVAWIGIGLAWILGWLILFLTYQDVHGLVPPVGGHQILLYAIPTGTTELQLGFQVADCIGKLCKNEHFFGRVSLGQKID